MDPFDWKVLESRQVIKDKLLSLRADKCQLPNGRILEPCYVMEYPAWVNVVALTKNKEVVLVKQFRHGIQKTLLELPGGTTDPEDLSPMAAIKRELLEETGFTGETFIETGRLCPNPATHNNFLHCFLAMNVEQVDKPRLDDTEQMDVVLMPLENVIEIASSGGLLQALHVSSLFLALMRSGRVH
jgi:ADP-ribose pyrophosphatase YjhB (NUDIX family)